MRINRAGSDTQTVLGVQRSGQRQRVGQCVAWRPGLWLALVWAIAASAMACRNVLSVPVPAGVIDPKGLTGGGGAEERRRGTIAAFASGFDVEYSGLITDEFTDFFVQDNLSSGYVGLPFLDARDDAAAQQSVSVPGTYFYTDPVYSNLQKARINGLLAASELAQSPPTGSVGEAGMTLALVGYSELLLAEEFCSGVPLTDVAANGGVHYGGPLTTDSLLGRAVADFDSALAQGVGNDTALNLARVGRGRALLDRGQYAAAAAAMAAVPAGFVYEVTNSAIPQPSGNVSFYAVLALPLAQFGHFITVSDREAGIGLNFVSAHDPRMPIDSTLGPTPTGTPFYYPAKFPIGGAPAIPLADWIEARLIQAEAALQAGDIPGWTAALNALRADSDDTHVAGLPALTADSTTGASPAEQMAVMFRERAFWLFGTGHRLGDLRRLIRQYGQAPDAVFPSGPYPATGLPPGPHVIASYGTDINFPVQAVETANPNFHGCLNRGA